MKALASFSALFATVAIHIFASFSSTAATVNDKPFVIPELREWKGTRGTFTPDFNNESGRPSIAVYDTELRPIAAAFADDYLTMFGQTLETAQSKVDKPAITMRLDKRLEKQHGPESYRIVTTPTGVAITAPSTQGAYWATRTLLQLSEQTPEHSLPCGTIVDYPAYALRGLSMDVGRKFIGLDYLRDLVKVMSYYKMNSLRVHLNDNGFPYYFGHDWDKTYAAFRLESDRFPGLAARDGYYTKSDFRDFQATSSRQFVDIVPEIDVPAHALAFARYRKGIGSEDFGQDHLDLFNDATMPFIDSLFAEYLEGPDPVFINEYVHIGTDEFGKDYPGFDRQKETSEKFRSFVDHYIRLIESYGKKPWVWGSLSTAPGETPVKTEGVMLDAWYNGYADPKAMADLGFKINSIPDGMVYIVPAAGYYHDYLNTRWLYENWTPLVVGNVKFDAGDPAITGGYFAVWNDHVGNGISVQDIHHRVMPAMQTMAVKLWDGEAAIIPYDEFDNARLIMSEAPGVNRLGRVGQPGATVLSLAEVKPESTLPLREIGYDYNVSFDIEARPEAKGTVLFESPDATFYLSDPIKGLMGFSRDGYLYTFNFRPYDGEKVSLRIDGTNKSTTLWVNGEKYESLDIVKKNFEKAKNPMYYVQTLVFPLERTGSFNSRVTNLKVRNATAAQHVQ